MKIVSIRFWKREWIVKEKRKERWRKNKDEEKRRKKIIVVENNVWSIIEVKSRGVGKEWKKKKKDLRKERNREMKLRSKDEIGG